MTPKQVGELVKRILGAYPSERRFMSNDDLGAMTVTYTAGLADLDFELAKASVDRASKTSEKIPTIARIRAEVGELLFGQRRSGAEAWEDVLAEVRRIGSYGKPVWRDPLVGQAARAVGWRALCVMNEADPAPRAKFADAYNRLAQGERKQAQLADGAGAEPPRRRFERVEEERSLGSLTASLMLDAGEPADEGDHDA